MSRVEEIKKQMQELQKELELEMQKTEIEYPPLRLNQQYWVINSEGEVLRSWWSEDGFDKNRCQVGNVFITEEEARKERDRRILLTRFRQFRDKCNGDWKSDFLQHLIDKYSIQFNYAISDFVIVCSGHNDNFHLFGYFKNEEDAERAIELFGDEIKRLYVEE